MAETADDRLDQQIAFLNEADKLKSIVRGTTLCDASRYENSAEHSWHLTLYALVLAEQADPQVDINGRSLVLRATLPNPDHQLQAGLFARVELILERRENAMLIPEQALVPQGDQQFVFTIGDENKVALTPVTIGRRQNGEVEITKGLEPDQTVVTAGQLKIRDGAPVTPLPPPDAQQG